MSEERAAKLAVRNVSKTFQIAGPQNTVRSLAVLRHVDFEVYPKEIVSIIG